MTDARKEAIERVAKEREWDAYSTAFFGEHPAAILHVNAGKLFDEVERAIVRGRLLERALEFVENGSEEGDMFAAEIRAELEGQDGK